MQAKLMTGQEAHDIAAVCADYPKSAQSLIGRTGIESLLADRLARIEREDRLLALLREALDRAVEFLPGLDPIPLPDRIRKELEKP